MTVLAAPAHHTTPNTPNPKPAASLHKWLYYAATYTFDIILLVSLVWYPTQPYTDPRNEWQTEFGMGVVLAGGAAVHLAHLVVLALQFRAVSRETVASLAAARVHMLRSVTCWRWECCRGCCWYRKPRTARLGHVKGFGDDMDDDGDALGAGPGGMGMASTALLHGKREAYGYLHGKMAGDGSASEGLGRDEDVAAADLGDGGMGAFAYGAGGALGGIAGTAINGGGARHAVHSAEVYRRPAGCCCAWPPACYLPGCSACYTAALLLLEAFALTAVAFAIYGPTNRT